MSQSNNDLVVVPLRVSREQRRVWRVEAGKEDLSVQAWIIGKLGKAKTEVPKPEAKPAPEAPKVERAPEGRKGYTSAYTKG